jgi:hypothetical protein
VADLPAIRARLAAYADASPFDVVRTKHYREDVAALLAVVEKAEAYIERQNDLADVRARAQVCGDYEPIWPAEVAARDARKALVAALAPHPGGGRG